MNGKYIKILLLLILVIIAAIVVFDNISNKPGNILVNFPEFDLDEYKVVDDSLISHVETKQISLKGGKPRAITYNKGKIYLLFEDNLQVIMPDGIEILKKPLGENPVCITIADDNTILVGFENYLVTYDKEGNELNRSSIASEKSLFTALAFSGDLIFVADAGTRMVQVYNKKLRQTGSFKGESGVSDQHGFIVPSSHFDLAVNKDNELWVVNPGVHSIQNYSTSGRLRGYWSKTSFEFEGFSGCCNPFYIAFLSDGSFVTSEKGIVRIKIHKPSGELSSVVAPPDKFIDGSKAPAIAVDENDIIMALDFDKNMIRFFEPK